MGFREIVEHLGAQGELLIIIQADFNASYKLDFLYN